MAKNGRFRKMTQGFRTRRSARRYAAAPARRRSGGGLKAETVVRTVAALSAAAIVLFEPLKVASEHKDDGFIGVMRYTAQGLKDQKAGVYLAAFGPVIAAEAGIAGTKMLKKAPKALFG